VNKETLVQRLAVIVSLATAAALGGVGTGTAAAAHAAFAPPAVVARAVAAAPRTTSLSHTVASTLRDTVNDNGYRDVEAAGCDAPPERVQMPACVYGDRLARRTLMLFGDSHAEMWLPGFDLLGRKIHWKVLYLAKSGCPPADFQTWDPFRNRFPFKECDEWHRYVVARIRKAHPSLLVLTDEYLKPEGKDHAEITPKQWTAGLVKTLKLVKTPRMRQVILGDIPYLTQSAPECLARHASDVQACSAKRSQAVIPAHVAAEKAAAKAVHARYVDVTPWFCSATCTAVIADTVVYSDQYHITGAYGIYLTGALQAALGIR